MGGAREMGRRSEGGGERGAVRRLRDEKRSVGRTPGKGEE